MKPHVGILHQLYGEIVGKTWELSGIVEYPGRSYYFSPTPLDGLWVDIRFDTHCQTGSIYLEAAILRLYDPVIAKDSFASGIYLEVQAFDGHLFSQSGFVYAVTRGGDPNKQAWCEQVVQDSIKLKRQATFARIISLISLRSFCLWAEDQSSSCVSVV